MRVPIYNENCVQAGKPVGDRELEQAEADNDGHDCDPWAGCDWTIHKGSPEDLLALADDYARQGGGAYGQFLRRKANTLRLAVYDERPDLKPIDESTQ